MMTDTTGEVAAASPRTSPPGLVIEGERNAIIGQRETVLVWILVDIGPCRQVDAVGVRQSDILHRVPDPLRDHKQRARTLRNYEGLDRTVARRVRTLVEECPLERAQHMVEPVVLLLVQDPALE